MKDIQVCPYTINPVLSYSAQIFLSIIMTSDKSNYICNISLFSFSDR